MGWNGSDGVRTSYTRSTKPKASFNKIVPFAALGILIVVSILFIFSASENENIPLESKKENPRKLTTEEPIANTPAPVVKQAEKPTPVDNKAFIEMKSKTPEERKAIRQKKLEEKELDLTVSSNRVFKTGTEQILSWIFTTEVGELPPPLPKIPDTEMAHFAKILLSDNPIKEGDSEFSANAKEMVKLAKKEMVSYIEKGGSPEEFLDYYRGQLVQAHEKRKAVRQEVMKVLREEPEIALQYLDEVNAELDKEGIKRVTLHPKQLKHFGINVEENQ